MGELKILINLKLIWKSVDGVMIGRAAYENPFMLKDVDSRFYNKESFIESKKQVLNKYFEYVDRQVKKWS